jgi:transposase
MEHDGEIIGEGRRRTGPPSAAGGSRGSTGHLERVRRAVASLRQQIADAALEHRMLAEADERPTRLMTVPGVGPVTAARFVTAILARGDDRAHNHRDAQPAITLIRMRLANGYLHAAPTANSRWG